MCDSPDSICAVPKTSCSFDDSNTGLKRCYCEYGTIKVKSNDTFVCGK